MGGGWLNKLVMIPGDRRLLAKIVSHEHDQVEIEFFQSVASRERVWLPVTAAKHTKLLSQTRVFVQTAPYAWRVGRITDGLQGADRSFTYEVRFPNSKTRDIHEDHLF